jgi:putative ABC transport system permease protein
MEEHLLASAIHGLGSSISGSTAELGPELDGLNKELGETKAIIETAGKKVSEVVDSRAQEVAIDLRKLTAALVGAIRTMQQIAEASVAQPRCQAWIIGAFAAVALILAALGIYGVMSCLVTQSTGEMGIRMALGARPGDLLRMTLGKGLLMAIIGLGLGLAGSFALTRVVQNLLYRVAPTDPLTYIVVSVLLVAVAMLATYIPARRAARLDPMVALRWE